MDWIIIILLVIDIWSSSTLRKNNHIETVKEIKQAIKNAREEILRKLG